MKFEMNFQDKAFLKLAAKVASSQATAEEQLDLEKLLHDHPRYEPEFLQLKQELRQDHKASLWLSALRVMLKTADPKEIKNIAALKQADPEQWREYQDAKEFTEALASREESVKTMKIQAMPDHVRKELLARLKASREHRNSLRADSR